VIPAVARAADPSPPITYETRLTNPVSSTAQDSTIEQYVIARIDEAQPGSKIGFAVRDWTVQAVADAVQRAADRGVDVTGVIDGDERTQAFLQNLVTNLGGKAVFCGAPDFAFNSCLSNVLQPGLMHNKFWLFSQLPDGSRDVVVETSQNWLPSQRSLAQDMVRINNDAGLYGAYRTYLDDLKAQQRTDDYYRVASGDDGRNTIYPMPRRQANIWTDDTIVDRLDEVACPGTVRVAQAYFRRQRMAIADKLVDLERQGCDVEVINSNGDADVVAKLVNAGVRYDPFYLGLDGVQTHTKYWLVDAGSTVTGTRTKIVYAGSDNWRADEQQTDDLLLRVSNDGVYDAYASHWEGLKARAVFVRKRAPAQVTDTEAPATVINAVPGSDALRITGSDGVGDFGTSGATGIKRLHVEMTGAQTGTWDFADSPPYTVALTRELTVSAAGTTTVTAYSEDHKGNVGPADSYVVMNGDEGTPLSTTGTFPAQLAITKVRGAGTVTDAGDGTWTWRFTPPDDGSGTVVVQASDGHDVRLTHEFHWSAANVAPTLGAVAVSVPPGAACQGPVNRVGLSFTVSDPADDTYDPMTGSIDWGDGSAGAIAGRSISAYHSYAPGTYSIGVSVNDGDGGTAGARTSAAVRYAMSRILRPFRPDGTSVFRHGRTIRVKVRIRDCRHRSVAGLAPTVATQRRIGDTPFGPIADAPGTMRFNRHTHRYVYNLSTRGFDWPAAYFVYVREAHSGESSQEFALK
jgi:hypothetical protein